MPDTNPQPDLYELFKRWLHNPDAVQRSESPAVANRVAAEGVIEDALWKAYRAGYAQATRDGDGAQRLMDFLSVCKP